MELARDIIGSQPILTVVSRDRRRLSGRPDQYRRLLARRRRRAVRRPGHRRVRAESPDHRADRSDRPDHVPLRHRHAVRPAVLRGHGRAAGRKYNLLALVAVLAGLAGRARARANVRHQDRPYARPLRRLDDQHRDAAGGARRHAEQGSVDRLLGRLSVRRDRADPVHLFHDAGGASRNFRRRRQQFHMAEITLGASCAGRTLDDLTKECPPACR